MSVSGCENGSRWPVIQWLSSVRLFLWLMGLIVTACVIGATVPQGEPADVYSKIFGTPLGRVIQWVGINRVFATPWFNVLLAGLGINLAACTWLRLADIRTRPGVFVTHISVLVILIGSLIRVVFGQHGVLPMRVGEIHGEFVIGGNKTAPLPFRIRLDDFNIDFRSGGRHALSFHNPKTNRQETIDITGTGTYKLESMNAEIKVIGMYSDFVIDESGPKNRSDRPDNPAVRIEIIKNGRADARWLFAFHPEFQRHGMDADASPLDTDVKMDCCDTPATGGHGGGEHGESFDGGVAAIQAIYEFRPGDIRQFRSRLSVLEGDNVVADKTIQVNDPLRYGGFTFYQSSYDPDDLQFTSLQVARDPSVPIVYLGFILLPIGLILSYIGKTPPAEGRTNLSGGKE